MTRRAITNAARNILAVYLDASDLTREAGAYWYQLERERCADFAARRNMISVTLGRPRRKLSAHEIAGAAAAISPGLKWETTFSYIEALLRDPRAMVPTYARANVDKANRILAGEDPLSALGGPKVRAFYGLLSGTDLDAVVIDGHAWNICMLGVRPIRGKNAAAAGRVTASRYRIAAAAYREVAEIVGAAPHAVQAATWIHWREIIKEKG